MRDHMIEQHNRVPESKEDLIKSFRFKLVRRHTTPLARQLHESITIN